jgi:5-formyltetrahydrofolate cyclo-ligase
MITKKDIRKHFLELRLNLPDQEAAKLNLQLLRHCKELDYNHINLAHIFLPIIEKKEVNTWLLLEYLRRAYPAMQWALSKTCMETGTLTHFLWEEDTVLVKSKYGILEPAGGKLLEAGDIDLVFVPMLAFDEEGHRIGYGKGMYDRFLSECRADARTIGLSLFEPVPVIVDTNEWDVPLQTVVTPYTIYQFKK